MLADNVTTIAPETIRQLLDYDPDTGVVKWRMRPLRADGKPNDRIAPGAEAGWIDATTGYRRVGVAGVQVHTHRLVWVIATGEWPEVVDHINGNKTGNRLANLRAASAAENACNVAVRSDNSSGHPGVSWDRRQSRWYAYIAHKGRTYSLGRYAALADAIAARRAGETKFHADFAQHASRGIEE